MQPKRQTLQAEALDSTPQIDDLRAEAKQHPRLQRQVAGPSDAGCLLART